MQGFRNRTVVVTGASAGVGRAIAAPGVAARLAPVIAGGVLLFSLGLLARSAAGRRPRFIRRAH